MPLDNLRKQIAAIRDFDWSAEAEGIVERHKVYIADLQASQLARGKDSKGQDLTLDGGGYAPFTIAKKQSEGKGLGGVTDRITWFMSGALYQSLYTEVENKKFGIRSDSFKFQKMLRRSAVKSIGLNSASLQEFRDSVTKPEISRIVKEKLGLTINHR